MSIEYARAAIRLIALTTVLIGIVLTTMTIIAVLGWGQASIDVTGHGWSGADMSLWAVLAHGSIIAWGLALFTASPRLAELVAK